LLSIWLLQVEAQVRLTVAVVVVLVGCLLDMQELHLAHHILLLLALAV
jgi:hypothetical protein